MDFKRSFQNSISKATNLEKERKEIASIFVELNKQINEITEGKISISIIQESEKPLIPLMSMEILLNSDKIPKNSFIAAELCVLSPPKIVKLARWKTSLNGAYPCTIIYQEQESISYDKDSLITELNNLIDSPQSGIIFKKLLDEAGKI